MLSVSSILRVAPGHAHRRCLSNRRTMSQGHTRDSQKTPKDNGTCSVCWSTFKLQRATGHIHRHGPRDSPCLGSDRPPASSSTPQPLPSTAQQQSSQPGTVIVGIATGHQSSVRGLSHPPWVRSIRIIPRAARASCRDLLMNKR